MDKNKGVRPMPTVNQSFCNLIDPAEKASPSPFNKESP